MLNAGGTFLRSHPGKDPFSCALDLSHCPVECRSLTCLRTLSSINFAPRYRGAKEEREREREKESYKSLALKTYVLCCMLCTHSDSAYIAARYSCHGQPHMSRTMLPTVDPKGSARTRDPQSEHKAAKSS
eukprot:223789-Amphidinium_carterae.1